MPLNCIDSGCDPLPGGWCYFSGCYWFLISFLWEVMKDWPFGGTYAWVLQKLCRVCPQQYSLTGWDPSSSPATLDLSIGAPSHSILLGRKLLPLSLPCHPSPVLCPDRRRKMCNRWALLCVWAPECESHLCKYQQSLPPTSHPLHFLPTGPPLWPYHSFLHV